MTRGWAKLHILNPTMRGLGHNHPRQHAVGYNSLTSLHNHELTVGLLKSSWEDARACAPPWRLFPHRI